MAWLALRTAVHAGAHVTQLVIVVSAYAGATLATIHQPFVSIQDPRYQNNIV